MVSLMLGAMETTTSVRDMIAMFYKQGRDYVVTLGMSETVLATFRTHCECQAYVEQYNAKVAASLAQ